MPDHTSENCTCNDSIRELIDQFAELRKHRQITQDELDAIMGNADRQISKWECGMRTPRVFNLICWADALDAQLVLNSNEKTPPPVDFQMEACNDNVFKTVR